ncbi:MAG: endonuclease/exonuclease/phosphatase family protein [Promethearchaeota archaeon]
MKNNKEIYAILLIAIISFFFIETGCNLVVHFSAYIFNHTSDISHFLPGGIITLILVIVELIAFMSKKIERKYRLFIIVFVIIGLRIASQFIVMPDIIFVLKFTLFFATLIFFIEILLFIELHDSVIDYSMFLCGMIVGIGIQFFFYMINISLSLTTDPIKIIPTIVFSAILATSNLILFSPKKFESYPLTEIADAKGSVKKQITLLHPIIFASLFLFSILWILNPMALSAYDVLNLSYNGLIPYSVVNYPSYGYTYYLILILIVGVFSYFLLHKKLFSMDQKKVKKIVLSSIGISFILNFLAIWIIENDFTFFSTFYITILSIITVFSLVTYISYLFYFYSFSSKRKLYAGLIIFFIFILFDIVLQQLILWDYRFSVMINSVIIVAAIGTCLIFLTELQNINVRLTQKNIKWNLTKPVKILFIIIVSINIGALGIIITARIPEPEQKISPTLMTWNLHNGFGVDDVFDFDRIADEIKEYDPDIIGLNEVDFGSLKTSFVDITSYLAHKLNMHYYYGYTFYKHYGNAILSKYPIRVAEIIELPQAKQSTEPRSMIRAKFEINSEIWTIFVTHLSTSKDDRLVQVPYIVAEIDKEIDFERICWLGDFNFDPNSKEYSLIDTSSDLRFIDTYRYLNKDFGFTGNFDDYYRPQRRIDYIMCSPDLIPKSSVIHCSIASDHCAVITKF